MEAIRVYCSYMYIQSVSHSWNSTLKIFFPKDPCTCISKFLVLFLPLYILHHLQPGNQRTVTKPFITTIRLSVNVQKKYWTKITIYKVLLRKKKSYYIIQVHVPIHVIIEHHASIKKSWNTSDLIIYITFQQFSVGFKKGFGMSKRITGVRPFFLQISIVKPARKMTFWGTILTLTG